jgi:putative peptidoglycan lipid II flippase
VVKRAEDAAAPPAARGLVLDGRYRLDQVRNEHPLGPSVHGVLWRAIDQSLERKVAVLLVTGLTATGHQRVARAAARASAVTDGRFVRIFDVGQVVLEAGAATWIATEWVEAPSLAATVRGGPLPPDVATEVVRQCAEALVVAAGAGCHHGRLHPDQVLLPANGVPRITGLEVAAALAAAGAAGRRRGADPGPAALPPAEQDARHLGALLFASLTARWPLDDWTGLPTVDGRLARQARPRVVRAGIGRDLDAVTHQALTGTLADPQAVVRALAVLPSRPLDAPPEPPIAPGDSPWSRWLWRVVPPLVVLAIGLTGWAVGSDLGRVPSPARQPHAALPPARASAAGVAHASLVWHRPPAITSFDPEGDGQEDEDAVGLAVDRDATTAWETATYRGSPHFGGLKSGVGLLLDLRRQTTVRVAELALTAAGSDLQIRAGDTRPQQAGDLPVVAARSDAGDHVRLDLSRPTRARYWLLWFTSLPRTAAGDYQVGVAELALLG